MTVTSSAETLLLGDDGTAKIRPSSSISTKQARAQMEAKLEEPGCGDGGFEENTREEESDPPWRVAQAPSCPPKHAPPSPDATSDEKENWEEQCPGDKTGEVAAAAGDDVVLKTEMREAGDVEEESDDSWGAKWPGKNETGEAAADAGNDAGLKMKTRDAWAGDQAQRSSGWLSERSGAQQIAEGEMKQESGVKRARSGTGMTGRSPTRRRGRRRSWPRDWTAGTGRAGVRRGGRREGSRRSRSRRSRSRSPMRSGPRPDLEVHLGGMDHQIRVLDVVRGRQWREAMCFLLILD